MDDDLDEILDRDRGNYAHDIDIAVPFVGRAEFLLHRALYFVQGSLTRPAQWVLPRLLAPWKKPDAESPTPRGPPVFTFYLDRRIHRIVCRGVQQAIRLINIFSSYVGGDDVYGVLLRSDPNVPLLGFTDDALSYTIEELGPVDASETRGWNAIWVSSSKPTGQVRIVAVRHDGIDLEFTCCWLSGPYLGRLTTVRRNPFFERKKDLLAGVYAPPAFLKLAILGVLGAPVLLQVAEALKTISKWVVARFV